ncbi:hypothetical protein WES18_23005, partial [Escherichia albertii]
MQKNVTPGRRKGCPNYPPEFKQQLVAASCFCLGLLNLHKKYSKARLNAACARALKTKVWRLSGIK